VRSPQGFKYCKAQQPISSQESIERGPHSTPSGSSSYTYDSMNRLLSEDGPWDSDTISYGYTQGLRTSLSLLQPYASPWAQTYSYDAAKRLTSLTALEGTYTYDYGDASCSCATKSLIKKLTIQTRLTLRIRSTPWGE
jgi:YD repeat-containing protein